MDKGPGDKGSCRNFREDITERKKAGDMLPYSAEEWKTTFDSITDMVSIHDKNYKIVRVNKSFADAFKTKPQELVGKTCYKLVHGRNNPRPACPHKRVLETKRPAKGEFFEPHLGIYLEVSASPIFNEKGGVIGSVHIAKDITERKKMEEDLKRRTEESEKLSKLCIDRELKMTELKKRVKELEGKRKRHETGGEKT